MKFVAKLVMVCVPSVLGGLVLGNIVYDAWFAPPPAPRPYVQDALIIESDTLYAVPIVLTNGTHLWIGAITAEDGYQTWMANPEGILSISHRASMALAKEDLSIVQATVLAEKNDEEVIRPILDGFKASGGAPRQLTQEQGTKILEVVRGANGQQTRSNYLPLMVAPPHRVEQLISGKQVS